MRTFTQKQNQPQRRASFNLTKSNTETLGASHHAHPILHLQRTIGNQAMPRLLQNKAGERKDALTCTALSCFSHDFSRIPVHPPTEGTIQTKLAFNTPWYKYEQEADHIAEQVMRLPESSTLRTCAGCDEEDRSAGGTIQRTYTSAPSHGSMQRQEVEFNASHDAPQVVSEVVSEPGRPLDPLIRSFMESGFGHDFSHVRIHTGSLAVESAQAVNALAYTVGRHVVFDEGAYRPETRAGRRLIAHELSHVVQQSGVTGSGRAALIQRQVNSDKPAPAEEDKDGEALRAATLAAAQEWVNEEFTTQEKIDEVRNREVLKVEDLPQYTAVDLPGGYGLNIQQNPPGLGAHVRKVRPFANYTTCVEFAMMVFKQAALAQNEGELKEGLRVARLLPKIFQTFAKETEVRATIAGLQQFVDQFKSKEAEIQAEQQKRTEQLEQLETSEAGGPKAELKRKQKIALTKGKLDALAKRLEILGSLKTKQEGRVEKQERKLAGLEEQNAAWIKPGPGLAAGGPKPGDLILTGQIKKGAFGVPGGQMVTLGAGAFRHIAILAEPPETVDEDVQKWITIDGGGTKALQTTTFVRLSDHLVFYTQPPATPPTKQGQGPAASFLLLGWIDTAKLLVTPSSAPAVASP